MSFNVWGTSKVADIIISSNTGLDAIKRAPIVNYDTGVKCIRIQDISQMKNFSKWGFCEVEKRNFEKFKLKKDDILVARTGASIGVNKLIDENMYAVFNNGLIRLRADTKKVDSRFLFYNMQSERYKSHLYSISGGTSTQPNMKMNALLDFEIMLPPLSDQRSISNILKTLDDKINLNNRINQRLEELAQTIFKSWFVDFEPFKDGEFVESELGLIPKGWRIGKLNDIIENFDSKRIPLSSRERQKKKGIFPYYGATSIMDYIDDFIFDGVYVLLGEDGTVVDANGYPILQYVWGKFWVNNHAHILKGKNGFSEESIYLVLRNTNIQGIVTGAVQLKINQANLKSVHVVIPPNNEIAKFNNQIKALFGQKRMIHEQNQILISIRDSLLPKLMSGEIRVPLQEKA